MILQHKSRRYVIAALPLFLTIILSAQTAQSPSARRQQQTKPPAQSKAVQKPPTPGPVTCVCAPSQTGLQPQAPNAKDKTKNWQDWFWPPEWAGWALVVVAIWTACIALDTLKQIALETKHSGELAQAAKGIAQTAVEDANAASTTARAAERSADSVKNIYRAWVLTGWTMGNIADRFEVWFYNYGQTPAQVIAKHCKTGILSSEAALANLPIPPDCGPNLILAPEMVPPHEGRVSLTSLDAKMNADLLDEWQGVFQGGKITIIYGLIKYLDVLDPTIEHETRFCYWHSYKRNGLQVGGPAEYNRAT